jgi:zona occludens toxin
MSITLVTGAPGNGKTAHVVDMLIDYAGKRPVFVDGITDLLIEHEPCPPVTDWTHLAEDASSAQGTKISFTFPPNALVVIDEAQRVYRPRAASSRVPPEVAAFETHRHLGIDFILITQHPSLLDSNIRRLIGRHIHIRNTAFGRYRYEWAECGDPDSKTSRDIAASTRYTLPKRAFRRYKSAELHTKTKIKLPMYAWVFLFSLISIAGIAWYMTNRISAKLKPETPGLERLAQAPGAASPAASGAHTADTRTPISEREWVAQQQPRVEGLPHSAPIFDQLTQATEVPEPVGCMDSKRTGCKCYTQQGTLYQTTESICRSIIKDGFFIHWKKPDAPIVASIERSKPHSPESLAALSTTSPGTP